MPRALWMALSAACVTPSPTPTDGPDSGTTSTGAATGTSGTTAETSDTGELPVGPWDLVTQVRRADDVANPAGSGLCAALYEDPKQPKTPALASVPLGPKGALEISGIDTADTSLGLLLEIDDCDGKESDVLRSAAAILPQHFDDLRLGEDYAHPVFVMTSEYEAAIRDGLETLGAPLAKDQGFVFGFVRDADGTPIDGATVSIDKGAGPLPTYYADTDASDGLFGSGTTPNTATVGPAESRWIVPVGPVAALSASHPDHTFQPQANISLPLEPRAVFVVFVAEGASTAR